MSASRKFFYSIGTFTGIAVANVTRAMCDVGNTIIRESAQYNCTVTGGCHTWQLNCPNDAIRRSLIENSAAGNGPSFNFACTALGAITGFSIVLLGFTVKDLVTRLRASRANNRYSFHAVVQASPSQPLLARVAVQSTEEAEAVPLNFRASP